MTLKCLVERNMFHRPIFFLHSPRSSLVLKIQMVPPSSIFNFNSDILFSGGLFHPADDKQEIAFRYAVEKINNDRTILPRSKLSAQIEKMSPQDSFHASKKGNHKSINYDFLLANVYELSPGRSPVRLGRSMIYYDTADIVLHCFILSKCLWTVKLWTIVRSYLIQSCIVENELRSNDPFISNFTKKKS